MYKYILKRLLLIIPTILGVVLIIQCIMMLTPSSPASIILTGNVTQEQIDALDHELGYDQPMIVQFFRFVKDIVLHFDFGDSYRTGKSSHFGDRKTIPCNYLFGPLLHGFVSVDWHFPRHFVSSQAVFSAGYRLYSSVYASGGHTGVLARYADDPLFRPEVGLAAGHGA